jgi:hypothetical protein
MNIKKLLEVPFWPSSLTPNKPYTRLHDDHDGTHQGRIGVIFDQMGDAYIFSDHQPFLRFRTWGGGGNSLRVRNALVILAEAIRLDNEDKPDPPSVSVPTTLEEKKI